MNKLVLVTGGSRGLGKNAALMLAAKGMDVVITYLHNKEAADEVVASIRWLGQKAAALPLNVGDVSMFGSFTDELSELLSQYFERENIDALINNAGMGEFAAFADTTEAQFDGLMNVHLKGAFFLTQSLLPLVNNGGKVINVSSGLTRFSEMGFCAYAMMKAGVEVMTRYLALELGPRQISVNTLAPGAIETDFGGGVVRDNTALNESIASKTALGRVGLPDDIGKAMLMLLSDEAQWLNGQRIEVSGGIHL
ncbi:SDR family NAD(P)-dependent oxidoreductase [Shewanella frigidimarina]|uniref:SDR family NAD(P)-dependent oxidoreductase n=1 Tax=Shewanella frigidimarina TaxID=56812 RepID=UPI003F9F8CD1